MTETKHSILIQSDVFTQRKKFSPDSKSIKQSDNIEKIIFIGTGTSFHCAMWGSWFAQDFVSAEAVSSWDFLATQTCRTKFQSQLNVLYVVISHRGCRGITSEVLKHLKKEKVVLIKAQGAPDGGFVSIDSSSPETSEAHTKSLTGAMAAIVEICQRLLPHKKCQEIEREKRILSDVLSRSLSYFFSLKIPNPSKVKTYYTLGGGPFYPVAYEASLKLIEMAHRVSRPFQLEEFLHGPFACLRKGDVLVSFQPFVEGGGVLEKKLYVDRKMKAFKSAKLLGVQILMPTLPKSLSKKMSSLALPWQAVIELVWAQVFALKCAEALKINPDFAHRDDKKYDQAFKLSAF